MKVTKSYIKQLIMEELNPEAEGGGATFGEGNFETAKTHMKQVGSALKAGPQSAEEIKTLLAPLEQYIQENPQQADLLKRMLSNMLKLIPGR